MAGFNPHQPRDARGRWVDASGVVRVSVSILDRLEGVRQRRPAMTRERFDDLRRRARAIQSGQPAPGMSRREFADMVEFQHPRLRAEAIARTGSPRMPTAEALAREMGLRRRAAARRTEVARVPAAVQVSVTEAGGMRAVARRAQFRAVEGMSVRPRRRASATRI